MDVSDAGFHKIYKKNKHQGLEILYERYKKYVYTLAYRYAGNKEDALDLTQEVFVSIFKSLDNFKEEFSILPWVKRITVNKCLNFVRDRKEALSLNQTIDDDLEMQDLIRSPETTGGGGGTDDKGSKGTGGGAGSGAKISPTAILVIKGDRIEILPIKKAGSLEKLIDMVPDLVKKVKEQKNDE